MNTLKSLKKKYHSIEKINQNLNSNDNNMELDIQISEENKNNMNLKNNKKDKKFEFALKKTKRNYIEMKNNELNEQTKNDDSDKAIINNIENISINIHNNNFFFLNNTEKHIDDGSYGACILKKKFLKFH